MTIKPRIAFVLLVVWAAICLTPLAASAQELCRAEDTLQLCLNRLRAHIDEGRMAATEAAKADQQQAAKKTETGLEQVNGLSSSVKDLLPLLQLGGVLGGVQTDDETGLVTVALNTPFLGSTGVDKKDNALQLKAVIDTTAKLFEPLKKKLPEQNRDALAKQLVTGKDDAENVAVHASYNVSTRRLGRNFNQHKDTLDALFRQAVAAVTGPRDTFAERAAKLTEGVTVSPATTRWDSLSASAQATLEARLVAMVEAEERLVEAFAAAIKAAGLDLYGQLVLNQPQLQVTASRSFRDDLFGPDLLSGRISFEMGLGNTLNAALGEFNGRCAGNAAADCLAAYAAFLRSPERRAAIKGGSRLAFYLEFVRNEDYHFTVAAPALDLTIAKGTGWSAGLDYGRLIAVDDDGAASGRVDAAFKWEAPADKTIDRRFVASVTITKKLGEMSVPFGIVYANKPKFLTGVDHGLSANVGLKFNLFSALK